MSPRRRRPESEMYSRLDSQGMPAMGVGRTASAAILALQQRAGNRAVTRLLARAPSAAGETADERAKELASGAHLEAHSPDDESVEWENFGPLGKFMSEVTEEALHQSNLPKRLFGLLAKAWDVYELVEFAKTGDMEHLGSPAASAASKIADIAAEKIEEGSVSRVAVAAKVGGRVFLVAWTTYEAFKLGAWIRGAIDAQRREAEVRRDNWRHAMMQHVWLDYLGELAYQREQTFDLIMGGTAGHGQVPALTKEAADRMLEIMNEASDEWKELVPYWQQAAVYLAQHGGQDAKGHWFHPWNDGKGQIHDTEDSPKQLIAAMTKRLAEYFGRLRDLHTNPANWQLTEKQKETLRGSREVGPWSS